MAVVDVFQFRVKPGREPEVAALFKEATEMVARSGGPRARLFNTHVGGQDFLTRMVTIEHESLEAWAKDETNASTSSDWRAMREKVFGPDAPWTVVSRSLWTEIE